MLIHLILFAQTAAIPPMTVPIPSRVVPAQTVTINIPANCANKGCAVTFTIPQQALVSQTTKTPATTAPVTSGKLTYFLTCTIPALPSGEPDLSKPINCTMVQQ